MSMPRKPINNTYLLASLDSLLAHAEHNQLADPNLSTIIPFVCDIFLEEVMIHCRGNQAKAARILGVHRSTLRSHLQRSRKRSRPLP